MCLHVPFAVQHENWSPFMLLGKSSRALCTGSHCELLCEAERAQGSSWSCNRSMMESVVDQRLVSVGKSITLANGKSKDKLTPKFTASLLVVPIERKTGGHFFLCDKARNKRGPLAQQLEDVVVAPPEAGAWLVSHGAGMNRRGHDSSPRDVSGGFLLAQSDTSSSSTFGVDPVWSGVCIGEDLE